MRRLTTVSVLASAVLMLAACSGSAPQASTTSATTASAAAPSASPTATYAALKTAPCGATLPDGRLPVLVGSKVTSTPIHHSKVICGRPFQIRLDFTNLFNSSGVFGGCRNVPEKLDPQFGRPCGQPLKSSPDFQSSRTGATLVENQLVTAQCQKIGNHVLDQGTLQNAQGSRSNVWDWIAGGYVNDLWAGNAGDRHIHCHS